MTLAPQQDRLPSSSQFDHAGSATEVHMAAAVARSALDHWRHIVRASLLTAPLDGVQSALRGLAAWYERMCIDPDHCNPAPPEGLAASVALERTAVGPTERRIEVTHWAVRVAQELAAYRAQFSSTGESPVAIGLALAKLDVALLGASEHALMMRND